MLADGDEMHARDARRVSVGRRIAHEDRFLRRYGMQERGAADEADDEEAGPGWYASSRELEAGLLVRECAPGDALLVEWQALRLNASRSPA